MKPIYLLCWLLGLNFFSSAQMRTEISDWVPKHNLSSKLVQVSSTVTLWQAGLPAEVREYHRSALVKLTLYNADGLPVEMHEYACSDTPCLPSRMVYAYNDAGQKISETVHWGNDTLVPLGTTRGRFYNYNRRRKLEKITYSYINKGDKNVDVVEEYSYDENDSLFRKTQKESRSSYTAVWQYEYSTDEHNHKNVKEFFTIKRKLRLNKSYTYDTEGRLIREYEKSRGGGMDRIRTYKYVLDPQGDWTTKRIFERGRLVQESRKTILE